MFWVVLDDKTSFTKANFYDLNWNKLKIKNKYPNFETEIMQPDCYEGILNISKILCKDFPFVRCDFYITKDGFRFSEMTFFHWAGLRPFEPADWDKKLGQMLELPVNDSLG